jgi:hypothetical protein
MLPTAAVMLNRLSAMNMHAASRFFSLRDVTNGVMHEHACSEEVLLEGCAHSVPGAIEDQGT